MKFTDVEVGKEYEYKDSAYSRSRKVKVLEKGVEYWRYDFPCILVEFIDNGREEKVPAKRLKGPWEIAEKRMAAAEERKRQEELAVARMRKIAGKIESILEGRGISLYEIPVYVYGGGVAIHPTLFEEEATKFLEFLEGLE